MCIFLHREQQEAFLCCAGRLHCWGRGWTFVNTCVYFYIESSKKPSYVVLADYTAEGGDELSLQSGEMLIHMNRDPSGWTQVKRLDGAESGWVPSSYLREVCEYTPSSAPFGEGMKSIAKMFKGYSIWDLSCPPNIFFPQYKATCSLFHLTFIFFHGTAPTFFSATPPPHVLILHGNIHAFIIFMVPWFPANIWCPNFCSIFQVGSTSDDDVFPPPPDYLLQDSAPNTPLETAPHSNPEDAPDNVPDNVPDDALDDVPDDALDDTVDWEAEFDEDHDEVTGIGGNFKTFCVKFCRREI